MTYLPSWPASGELLIVKTIDSVGSSTLIRLRADGLIGTGDRVADFRIGQADQGHDVAGVGRRNFVAAQLVEQFDGGDFARLVPPVFADQHDLLILADRPALNAADRDATDVLGPFERRDHHLQRRVGLDVGPRNLLQHQVEQRLDRSRARRRIVEA